MSALAEALLSQQAKDAQWLDLKGAQPPKHAPIYYRYPAMMVSEAQAKIIDHITAVDDTVTRVLDPFVGSGVTLAESMYRGLDFLGQDLNPLSLLICQVRSGPQDTRALTLGIGRMMTRLDKDRSRRIDVEFFGRDKWFQPKVQQDLSRIRRAIMEEETEWIRRFLWMTLAEAARVASNRRSTTYKMHVRSSSDIAERKVDAFGIFTNRLAVFLAAYRQNAESLEEAGRLEGIHYDGAVELHAANSARRIHAANNSCDLVVSSPPYGDNRSTITYGQDAILSLRWIDQADLTLAEPDLLENSARIDTSSLGGQVKTRSGGDATIMSPTLARTLQYLSGKGARFHHKVLNFYTDLIDVIDETVTALGPGRYMSWTLGERMVARRRIPMAQILQELLEFRKCKHIATMTRKIHGKRMASSNQHAETMRHEKILIMQTRG